MKVDVLREIAQEYCEAKSHPNTVTHTLALTERPIVLTIILALTVTIILNPTLHP